MIFFSAEDFERLAIQNSESLRWHIAEIANQKLEREGKVVYSKECSANNLRFWDTVPCPTSPDTHRALLICVEELPKKECEHDVVCHDLAHQSFVCRNCNKDMKPTGWEVVE